MILEGLSLSQGPVDGRLAPVDGGPSAGEDGIKIARLPRWTRQEILVLIQGKKVAESRVKRGRVSGFGFGTGQSEPKWASVASYCRRHGVNRGPVQCRKRWSNLAGDFKKIKEWESKSRDEADSFWLMRNDLRRERKLPGFFDKEVYDILDGGGGGVDAGGEKEEEDEEVVGGELSLALAPASASEPVDEPEALFDSGRSALAEEGLFSDLEPSGKEEPFRSPRVINKTVPPNPDIPAGGATNEKHPGSESEDRSTQGGKKRKRTASDEEGEAALIQHKLIEALERNSKMLSSQLEAQNTHLQLDREQRNEHANSLISVLNKLADALGRIADKL